MQMQNFHNSGSGKIASIHFALAVGRTFFSNNINQKWSHNLNKPSMQIKPNPFREKSIWNWIGLTYPVSRSSLDFMFIGQLGGPWDRNVSPLKMLLNN